MGLFDRILKDITRAVTDSVIDNTVRPEIDKKINNAFGGNNSSEYTLPGKYSNFPKYVGTIIGKPEETNTAKYDRITMNFSGNVSSEFISSLEASGFRKSTSVRYDNQNTYVIVEPMGSQTRIVYHIKK